MSSSVSVDLLTLSRQVMLFLHTLAFALALSEVLRADPALLTATQLDVARLRRTGTRIASTLALLWVTGLGLLMLQGPLDIAALLALPKVAAKLTTVGLLTINGVLLHTIAFPLLARPQVRPAGAAALCALLGGISSSAWLYASFLGVARLIAPAMSYAAFMALYAAVLAAALLAALTVARPRLQRLIAAPPPG